MLIRIEKVIDIIGIYDAVMLEVGEKLFRKRIGFDYSRGKDNEGIVKLEISFCETKEGT